MPSLPPINIRWEDETNYFKRLPDETLLNIFGFCSKDHNLLFRMALVCKNWRRLVSDQILWQSNKQICLGASIHNKTWCEKKIVFKEIKVRDLIIDKSKNVNVLFDNGALYSLKRHGKFVFRHLFNKDVTVKKVENYLGGRFKYSSTDAFRLTQVVEPGVWSTASRYGGHWTPSRHTHFLQILDEDQQLSQKIRMNIHFMTAIDCVSRIEQFGEYILTCGLQGEYIGRGWEDDIPYNVVWKIQETHTERYASYSLEPIIQLPLSKRALLIDGLFIDIVDQNNLTLVDFTLTPITHKKPESSCTIV